MHTPTVSPFAGLLRQMDHFDREVARAFPAARRDDWQPRVDILNEADQVRVFADLPGIAPEDLAIELRDGVLTLSGARQLDEADGARYSRIERAHGRFVRQFVLGKGLDPERISATSEHGVLMVTIAKLEAATPRRITVTPTTPLIEAGAPSGEA